MKLVLRILSILFIIVTLSGCISNYVINIKEKREALVNLDYDKFYKSKINKSRVISNIDTTSEMNKIKFEIKNIDSLGNYLSFFSPNYFIFNLHNDTLKISNTNIFPFLSNTKSIRHYFFYISFPNKINLIKTNYKRIKKIEGNKILIKFNRRQLIDNNNLNILIKF